MKCVQKVSYFIFSPKLMTRGQNPLAGMWHHPSWVCANFFAAEVTPHGNRVVFRLEKLHCAKSGEYEDVEQVVRCSWPGKLGPVSLLDDVCTLGVISENCRGLPAQRVWRHIYNPEDFTYVALVSAGNIKSDTFRAHLVLKQLSKVWLGFFITKVKKKI